MAAGHLGRRFPNAAIRNRNRRELTADLSRPIRAPTSRSGAVPSNASSSGVKSYQRYFSVASASFSWHNAAMKRRYLIVAVSTAVIAILVLGTLALLPPRPGVTKANFDQIQEGMALDEVERVFGQSGRKYDWGNQGDFLPPHPPPVSYRNGVPHHVRGDKCLVWKTDESEACIEFADDQFVSDKVWMTASQEESLFDKVRRWLHLD